MKVKDLLEELNKLDPEEFVFVDGYEGGLSDPVLFGPSDVAVDHNKNQKLAYFGPHEEIVFDDEEFVGCQRVKALIIGRKNRR
jgi:hypothetical protein